MIIVDLSTDVAGRFAAKLLAMGGETVLRPVAAADEGASTRDPLSIYLDWKKTPARIAGRDGADGILADADIVFTSFDRGDYQGLSAMRVQSGLRCVEVTTSTFGVTGPYAQFRGGPAAQWACGGYLAITGEPDREPLMGPEHLCGYVTGYMAAIAAEAALRRRRATGRGTHVDVSVMETMLGLHQSTFSRLAAGDIRRRTGRYAEVYPLTVLPCRSGYVSLGVVTDEEFDRLALAFGLPHLLADDRFQSASTRLEHREALDRELDSFLSRYDAGDVAQCLQDNAVAAVVVASVEDIVANPQMIHRGFWTAPADGGAGIMPGNPIPPPARFGGVGNGSMEESACRANDDRAAALPLRGKRVLDFTAFWAGPSATRLLADLGAEVIWVERPKSRIDFDEHLADPLALSAYLYHQKMNRHKRSVVLDLNSAQGREHVAELVASADVVVENFRPGVTEKLGIGPAQLCTSDPRLVYVSLSGFGHGGPWGDRRSYGPNIEAASSILDRTGYRGGPPLRLGHALPDGVGGLAGALAALQGLRRVDETGVGGWFDISQLEVYTALSGEEILAASLQDARCERVGNRSRSGAIQGVFACKGKDQWIAIRLADEADLVAFAEVTGARLAATGWPPSSEQEDANDEAIAAVCRAHDKFELTALLQAGGVEAFPACTSDELVKDAHLAERRYFEMVRCDQRVHALPGIALRCGEALADTSGGAPRFGEHTQATFPPAPPAAEQVSLGSGLRQG